jgi:hypothetical protein
LEDGVKKLFWIAAFFSTFALGQDRNSLFENPESKSYVVRSITVQGEVQSPGPVSLDSLPLRSAAIKELQMENGKQDFKGAYFVTGYSLYDILNGKKFKKDPENKFSPPVDLYIIVENDKGEKAVFSWGEIYYRDSFGILITKSISAINPARMSTKWTLPEEPRLVCGSDLLSLRFLSNPTKITVKSFHGAVPGEKPKDIYSAEFKIATGAGSATIGDMPSSVQKRAVTNLSYGHGMGYKGVLNLTGFRLKDLIESKVNPNDLRDTIVVASAKDGYRTVLSASEILNRNDNQDIILVDRKGSADDGRYLLFEPGDFFADRDVRAVEKIELIKMK